MGNVILISRATGKEYLVFNNKDIMTIGRDVKGGFVNDIKIPNIYESRHVSKMQCKLYRIGDKVAVKDMESMHGTYVNGKNIGDKKIVLKDGFVLGLADYKLEVKIEQGEDLEELDEKLSERLKKLNDSDKEYDFTKDSELEK